MSTKRIFAAALVIIVVSALVTGGTLAYFSSTRDENVTVSTATIAVGETWNFPLIFSNLLPGETLSQDVSIKNTGNRDVDIYFQLLGDDGAGEINFCIPDKVLNVSVYDLDAGVWRYSGSVCDLYPGQASSVMPKLADNLPPGAWKNLRVYVTLSASAGNAYQNGTNKDLVHIVGVQFNGPAPIPNKQGFESGAYKDGWPLDNYTPDDDPNYP